MIFACHRSLLSQRTPAVCISDYSNIKLTEWFYSYMEILNVCLLKGIETKGGWKMLYGTILASKESRWCLSFIDT